MASAPFYETLSFGGSRHGQGQQVPPFKTSEESLEDLLLHGNLDIWVKKANNLPNMDMFHNKLSDKLGKFSSKISSKIQNHTPHKIITSDPYVTISVASAIIGRTFVIDNSENPVWMQHFNVHVAHYASEVHFVVKDSDVLGSQIIGAVGIPVKQLCSDTKVEGTFPILDGNRNPCKPGAVLTLSIQFIPIEKVALYHRGLWSGPDYNGVPGTYFPLRKGGKLTLYQDAHVHDGSLPNLQVDGNVPYEHGSCWRDICNAIVQARRLIYITGWSVYHNVRLVRETDEATNATLGDLLKRKSQEGVRVLLLVWDDPSSNCILGYKKEGIMKTSDEETRHFFKHSSVAVILCPRYARKAAWVKKQASTKIYSHHQKTVIVDADAGNNKRKIIAFVGGLDLHKGRYDTPNHPLFRTNQTVHKHDFYNPSFTESNDGCPRQPWHDLHCRIDGPAAYDILTNFEERWLKASELHGLKKLKCSHGDDGLLKMESIPEIVGMTEIPYASQDDPETWHVQVFRSIDSNAVQGFPEDPKDATRMNLVCGKNVLIDMSIHTAYVNAIRSAQRFIYIENQYFLGSSFNWDSYNNSGANNLIPIEIALKIANKIRSKERFSAYVLIPMWPEGDNIPILQAILFWQHKTMQMMYDIIYKALVEVGLENEYEPQDFLNFFCLGNREAVHDGDSLYARGPFAPDTPQALAQKNRRFMIYIHSKGMIVDDEYVIIGSANINQRSMDGTRDTEIAMGAYQPHHTCSSGRQNPHGQVYGYRMSLWAEHIGAVEESFKQPESLECVRRVRYLSEQNWKQYAADEVTEMKGHLLKYPVQVDRMGKVMPLPGCETFPDVGGKIVGSFTAVIPKHLTT